MSKKRKSRYTKVSTPNLPTGHFLLTDKEVKDLQAKTRKRRKSLK